MSDLMLLGIAVPFVKQNQQEHPLWIAGRW